MIGSTFSTGGEEETAPEWFGMGPQRSDAETGRDQSSKRIRIAEADSLRLPSLGFVGPGPQINPKAWPAAVGASGRIP